MTEIINFNEAKMKRELNPAFCRTMPDGSKWYKFIAQYKYEGNQGIPEPLLNGIQNSGAFFTSGTFTIEFWAQSFEKAEEMIQAMRNSLELEGQIYEEFPA